MIWVQKIIAFAVFVQTLEMLVLGKNLSRNGSWSWLLVRRDFQIFPVFLRKLFDLIFSEIGFQILLFIQLFSAALLAFPSLAPNLSQVWIAWSLFVGAILICMRWRGSFNGGSDAMTLVILSGLCIAETFSTHPKAVQGALWYIAIQVCLSYLIGGLVKIREKDWRTGRALSWFLNHPTYNAPDFLRKMSQNPRQKNLMMLGFSWIIILFECSFPLALSNPMACLIYIGAALIFHTINVYAFGLNRFLLVWAATYPALYYCAGSI